VKIDANGALVAAGPSLLPTGGTDGQVLTKLANGLAWAAPRGGRVIWSVRGNGDADTPTTDFAPYKRVEFVVVASNGGRIEVAAGGTHQFLGIWADHHDVGSGTVADTPANTSEKILDPEGQHWQSLSAEMIKFRDGGFVGQLRIANGPSMKMGLLVCRSNGYMKFRTVGAGAYAATAVGYA
jgi:hypothetical protein